MLFENRDGEGQILTEKELTGIMQRTQVDLEFVVVASCYSEFAGKVFLNAGARHVVCIKSGNAIADVSVILFSKTFYKNVYSQKMKICDSFKDA